MFRSSTHTSVRPEMARTAAEPTTTSSARLIPPPNDTGDATTT
ncbi:hypothetical protein ACIBIZ_49880 [Nonomuraea spiralis]